MEAIVVDDLLALHDAESEPVVETDDLTTLCLPDKDVLERRGVVDSINGMKVNI